MQRVKRATAVVALPAAPGGGTPGFFALPNPGGGVPATVPGYEWYNSIQEELCAVIEGGGGLTLDIAQTTQLRTAIQQMIINGGAIKTPVRVASVAATNLAAPGASIDGTAMVAGDRFLEKDHGTGSSRGIYIWNGAATPATRATDADGVGELVAGMLVVVQEGTTNADSLWELTTDGTITIGTTALTFARKDASVSSGQNDFANGSFALWQDTNGNGATFSWTSTTTGKSADLTNFSAGTGGTPSKTVTRQAWAKSNAANVNNNTYLYQSQQTANATATGDIDFFGMEYANKYQGGQCAVSAILFCASGTLVLTPTWLQNFGTGGSPSSSVSTAPNGSSTITINTTPTLYTFTFNVPSTTAKTFGSNNNDYCGLTLTRPLNTLSTLSVDSLKIEAGGTATPYRAPVSGEDAVKCKRVYEILGGVGGELAFGAYNAASANIIQSFTYTQKRGLPTASKVGTWNVVNSSQPVVGNAGLNALQMQLTVTALGAASTNTLTSSQYVSLDSRLF